MKFLYTNTTNTRQSLTLVSKDQETVGLRIFGPGASLELDYPGLDMYVPNILTRLEIGTADSIHNRKTITVQIPKPVEVEIVPPVVNIEPVVVPPEVIIEPLVPASVEIELVPPAVTPVVNIEPVVPPVVVVPPVTVKSTPTSKVKPVKKLTKK